MPAFLFERNYDYAVWYELNVDQTVHSRTIYSFLELLGDVGGFYDALRLIGAGFMAIFPTGLADFLIRSVFTEQENVDPQKPDEADVGFADRVIRAR